MSASGSRTWPIGKEYDCGTIVVDAQAAQAYAAATNDLNPAYAGENRIVPPMFHVFLIWDMLTPSCRTRTQRIRGLAHGHDAQFIAPAPR